MVLEASATLAIVLVGVLLLTLIVLFYSSVKTKPVQASNAGARTGKAYTLAEVKKHNTRHDCWIIVKNKIYDVTPYVEEHPGGDTILNNAGGDSTEGFYGPQHVTRVFQMIDDFYIGDLQAE